jgi:hypothetical protein
MNLPLANTKDDDAWRTMALQIHRTITKGAGTSHARVETVRQMLIELARENYEAGQKAAADVIAADLKATLEKPGGPPLTDRLDIPPQH